MALLLGIPSEGHGQQVPRPLHLLLSETMLHPNEEEFIEVANPNLEPIVLDGYFLSDDQEYIYTPALEAKGGRIPRMNDFDFIVRWPEGTTIASGGTIVVAFYADHFLATFGKKPDFEIFSTDPSVPDMVDVISGIRPSISKSGESAVIFYWDGASDLVKDVDVLHIGAIAGPANRILDKTGLSVDGPDLDLVATAFAPEPWQLPDQLADFADHLSTKRVRLEEGYELDGGHGLFGDCEVSEDLLRTWDGGIDTPPNGPPDPGVFSFPALWQRTLAHPRHTNLPAGRAEIVALSVEAQNAPITVERARVRHLGAAADIAATIEVWRDGDGDGRLVTEGIGADVRLGALAATIDPLGEAIVPLGSGAPGALPYVVSPGASERLVLVYVLASALPRGASIVAEVRLEGRLAAVVGEVVQSAAHNAPLERTGANGGGGGGGSGCAARGEAAVSVWFLAACAAVATCTRTHRRFRASAER